MIRGGRGCDRKKIVTKILLIMIKVVLVLVNHIGHSMYVLEGVRCVCGVCVKGGVSGGEGWCQVKILLNMIKYD